MATRAEPTTNEMPEILARGPWDLSRGAEPLAARALRATPRPHRGGGRGDQRAARARIAKPRRARGKARGLQGWTARDRARAAAAALGVAIGGKRCVVQRGGAVRDARGRRTLAGREARSV